MARAISRKQLLKEDELAEKGRELTQWIEENWRLLLQIAAAILIAAALISIWVWNRGRNDHLARASIAVGADLYHQAEAQGFEDPAKLEQSLPHFDQALDRAGAKRARLARYYRGAALYRLGRGDEAIAMLEQVPAGEADSLSGAARSLLATVLFDNGQADRALAELDELVNAEDPYYPPDQALLQLAGIHLAQGDQDQARLSWQRVLDEFPDSNGAMEARERLGS